MLLDLNYWHIHTAGIGWMNKVSEKGLRLFLTNTHPGGAVGHRSNAVTTPVHKVLKITTALTTI